MGVFAVDTCIVKPEKQKEFMLYIQKFKELIKNKPELFRETKSMKFFNQIFGEQVGGYFIMMMEFDNLEDLAKEATRYFTDPETIELDQEFMLLIEPSSFARRVWVSID